MKRSLTTILVTALWSAPALAQDSDGDGVPDAADAFPCDPALAGVAFAPHESGWSMLAFEDQWPSWSDLDYNDVVVRTHFRLYTDAQGRVVRLTAFYEPVAHGGDYDNGLGLQLPVSRSGVAARRRIGAGPWSALALEPDASATLILSDNLRELFGGLAGPINSRPGEPIATGERLELEITFAAPVSLSAGLAPFDSFIFRSGDLGHQIHLPPYAGTQAMRTELFNTENDASTVGRYFTHFNGTPFALNLQGTARYPLEGVSIDALFPNIVAFAASGGQQHADFYLTAVVSAEGHLAPATSLAAEPGADTSCVVVSELYAFSSHTFTSCGQVGRYGPNLTQCRSAYSSASWAQSTAHLNVVGGIQTWTVPRTGTYRIEAFGAQGGNDGASGARMRGDFELTGGSQVRVLVGQQGATVSSYGGGGGGSFVTLTNNTPLLVAGGGGGRGGSGTGYPGLVGTTGGTGGGSIGGAGGTNGAGGQGAAGSASGSGGNGSGGGGLLGNGGGCQYYHYEAGGFAFVNGGAGGYDTPHGRPEGGFGGGGGSGNGPGGGGGYSGGGGGAGAGERSAGGGGSFNAGAQQSNTQGANNGHGRVVITRL